MSSAHILGTTNLNKFKSIKVISSIFSDHNSIKLEINHRKRLFKKNDYMETKGQATKNMNGSKRNSKGNLKIPCNK